MKKQCNSVTSYVRLVTLPTTNYFLKYTAEIHCQGVRPLRTRAQRNIHRRALGGGGLAVGSGLTPPRTVTAPTSYSSWAKRRARVELQQLHPGAVGDGQAPPGPVAQEVGIRASHQAAPWKVATRVAPCRCCGSSTRCAPRRGSMTVALACRGSMRDRWTGRHQPVRPGAAGVLRERTGAVARAAQARQGAAPSTGCGCSLKRKERRGFAPRRVNHLLCDGTNSCMTALRSNCGGTSPWASTKSLKALRLNFLRKATSAAWRVSIRRW